MGEVPLYPLRPARRELPGAGALWGGGVAQGSRKCGWHWKGKVEGKSASKKGGADVNERDWYFIAEQPAPAPHLAHPEGFAALRILLVTAPRVSRS